MTKAIFRSSKGRQPKASQSKSRLRCPRDGARLCGKAALFWTLFFFGGAGGRFVEGSTKGLVYTFAWATGDMEPAAGMWLTALPCCHLLTRFGCMVHRFGHESAGPVFFHREALAESFGRK